MASRNDATHRPALLLIAHGTRNPAGAAEMEQLVAHLRKRLEAPVAAAWLEDFAEPDAQTAAGEVVAAGASHVVTLPFLVLGAGHAKTDVPEQVRGVGNAFPDLAITHARVLGLHQALFDLARARIDAVAPAPDRADEVLVITGAGSSDPDANGDLNKAARVLAEQTGHRWTEIAFAGVTWPRADEIFDRLHRARVRRVVRFSWSLLAGVLEQRVDQWAHQATQRTGMEIADAGRFGPDPLVAEAVIERYREALSGDVRMNCDLCAYRLPLHGFEARVGAPSAGGLGTAVHPSAHNAPR